MIRCPNTESKKRRGMMEYLTKLSNDELIYKVRKLPDPDRFYAHSLSATESQIYHDNKYEAGLLNEILRRMNHKPVKEKEVNPDDQ